MLREPREGDIVGTTFQRLQLDVAGSVRRSKGVSICWQLLTRTHADRTAPIVRRDVLTSLSQLHQLAGTISRLSRSGASDPLGDGDSELHRATAELEANLRTIEPDLEELDESVAAVAEPGVAARLGISDREVRARHDFVERVKGEVAVRCDDSRFPLPPSSDLLHFVQAIRRQIPSQTVSPVRVHAVESQPERVAHEGGVRRSSTGSDILQSPPPTRRPTTPTTLEKVERIPLTTQMLLSKLNIRRYARSYSQVPAHALTSPAHPAVVGAARSNSDRHLWHGGSAEGAGAAHGARGLGAESVRRLQPSLPHALTISSRRLLDELDQHVDSTSSRLAKAQRRMDRFVRENSAFTSASPHSKPLTLSRQTQPRIGSSSFS